MYLTFRAMEEHSEGWFQHASSVSFIKRFVPVDGKVLYIRWYLDDIDEETLCIKVCEEAELASTRLESIQVSILVHYSRKALNPGT